MSRSPYRWKVSFAALWLQAFVGCGQPEPHAEAPVPAEAPVQIQVVTDGRLDEWGNVPALLEDSEDAPADAAVDIGQVRVTDDTRWLHLAVDVGKSVNAQAMRGTLKILFDADADPATGAAVETLPGTEAMTGVDAIVELSRRDRNPAAEMGAGNGFRPVTAAGPGELLPGYAAGCSQRRLTRHRDSRSAWTGAPGRMKACRLSSPAPRSGSNSSSKIRPAHGTKPRWPPIG